MASLLDGRRARRVLCIHSAEPRGGGCGRAIWRVRKIRWTRAGSGKSGGVRVIYFARTEAGEVVLLIMYAKSKLDALKASTLKELRNAVEKSLQADD